MEDGILKSTGHADDLVTAAKYWNFELHESEPGVLELPGDHGAVEFRNLVLTPLTRRK